MPTYGQAASDLAVRRLGPYAENISDDDLAIELTSAAADIRAKFVCIKNYDALSATDAVMFDNAVGLLTAIKVIDAAYAGQGDGSASFRIGSLQITSALPDAPEQVKWETDFTQYVNYISCVQAGRVQVAAQVNIMGVGGRTRQREETGRYSLPRMIKSILPSGWAGDRPAYFNGGFVELP